MKKFVLVLATLAFAAPALAGDLEIGRDLGLTFDAIRATLTADGWDVRKMEMDDGMFEVYAVKGVEMREIHIDPQTGKITRIKTDD